MNQKKTPKAKSSRQTAPSAKPRSQKAARPERIGVMVLAMHRSGSSALSRVLNLLGCDLPKTLMAADPNNQSGYWESDVLYKFNEKLLSSAGTTWRAWQAFNSGWYETPRFQEFLNTGQELLDAEFANSSFFVYKDPRTCRLVPFWEEVFLAAGVKPVALINIRHPLEIAQSLETRNRIPEAEAILIWLRHMLDAEHDSRSLDRAFISYDQLLEDPVEVATALEKLLGLRWPRLSDRTATEISGFVDDKQRHHRKEPERAISRKHPLHRLLNQAYQILRRWSLEGEDVADHAVLDELREELDQLSEPLSVLIETLVDQSNEMVRKDAALTSLSAARDAALEQAEALQSEQETELAKVRADLERAEAERAQLAEVQTAQKVELARVHADLERGQAEQALLAEAHEEEISALQAETHSLQSALVQRSHEAEETATALRDAQNTIEQQERDAKSLHDDLTQAKAQLTELQTTVETTRETLNERDRSLKRLNDRMAGLDTEVNTQANDLAQMALLILEKEEALKRRNAAAHEAETKAAELAQDLAQAREDIETRIQAISGLEQELADGEMFRQALLDSTSWRVTAPLRRLASLFRK